MLFSFVHIIAKEEGREEAGFNLHKPTQNKQHRKMRGNRVRRLQERLCRPAGGKADSNV